MAHEVGQERRVKWKCPHIRGVLHLRNFVKFSFWARGVIKGYPKEDSLWEREFCFLILPNLGDMSPPPPSPNWSPKTVGCIASLK